MAEGERLVAHLSLHHLRRQRLLTLRWAAAASLPIWLQANWGVFPNAVAWVAFLAEGLCVSLAATYAVLEHMWARRTTGCGLESVDPALHFRWSVVDELRSGVSYAFAGITLLPWSAVGLGWTIAAPLLSSLNLGACAAIALLAAAEAIAHFRRRATA
jgi:hypothetical protein